MENLILDPQMHYPSLYKLLGEDKAHYFTSEHYGYFSYGDFRSMYGFLPSLKKELQFEYENVYIVYPLMIKEEEEYNERVELVLRLYDITEKVKAKNVYIFDNSDRAVPSHTFLEDKGLPYNKIFKREYRHGIEKYGFGEYSDKTIPYPFVIFGVMEPIWRYLYVPHLQNAGNPGCVWAGAGIHHNKLTEPDTVCYRSALLRKINHKLRIIPPLSQTQFLQEMSKYNMFVHLNGVGQLCKRFYEGLACGGLMMYQKMDIVFPFENGEYFSDACMFETGEEFIEKYDRLTTDKRLFQEAHEQQKLIQTKYLAPSFLREYLNKHLNVETDYKKKDFVDIIKK